MINVHLRYVVCQLVVPALPGQAVCLVIYLSAADLYDEVLKQVQHED